MVQGARVFGGMLGVGALAVGAWDTWGRIAKNGVETVQYTVVDKVDAFEVREYPDVVVAKTVAGEQRDAFRRLYEYVDGANAGDREVAMTAPVSTAPGVSVATTAPMSTTPVESGVEVSFFLPANYTLASAPDPTNDRVDLGLVEHRRVAAVRFSWLATASRIDRARRRLDRELGERDVEASGSHELHRYDHPRSPPWQRRNELVVELA